MVPQERLELPLYRLEGDCFIQLKLLGQVNISREAPGRELLGPKLRAAILRWCDDFQGRQLERAMVVETTSSVWKTDALTVVLRPHIMVDNP